MCEQVYVCYEHDYASDTYEVVKLIRSEIDAESWLDENYNIRAIEKMDLE